MCSSIFFLGLALIASIGMPIFTTIKHPQGLVKPLIGVVGLVIIFGLSYAVSGSELTAKTASLGVNESSSKLIGAGMITFYFFLISSTVLAIYSLIKDIIQG